VDIVIKKEPSNSGHSCHLDVHRFIHVGADWSHVELRARMQIRLSLGVYSSPSDFWVLTVISPNEMSAAMLTFTDGSLLACAQAPAWLASVQAAKQMTRYQPCMVLIRWTGLINAGINVTGRPRLEKNYVAHWATDQDIYGPKTTEKILSDGPENGHHSESHTMPGISS
jgi:hypothetical protein